MTNPVPGHSVSTGYRVTGPHWASCGWHTGVDIAAPSGTRMVAAIAGTIRHRNYGSAFGPHQFAISPSKGQPFADDEVFYAHGYDRLPDGTEVQVGDTVGKVGAYGNATGPHLHFEYHAGKNVWNCGVMRDPQPVLDHAAGSSGGGSYPRPTSGKVYLSKLTFGQDKSDSVWYLQDALNKHSLPAPGNFTIDPKTGNYYSQTDTQVRTCQQAHGFGNDPEGASYVGPMQATHLFANSGLTIVNDLPDKPEPPPPAGWHEGDVWHPAASLLQLRDEIDGIWPDRDRSSDGTIGDTAHAQSQSEHNPVGHVHGPEHGTIGCVHALDVTAAGIDADAVVAATIGDPRLWYIIHAGFIYSKTYGWAKREYNGADPHTTHIHFSLAADDQVSAVGNEVDRGPWRSADAGDGEFVTVEQFDRWRAAVADTFGGEL